MLISCLLFCYGLCRYFVIAVCILRCDGLEGGRARFHTLLVILPECIVLGISVITFVFFNIFCGHILKGGGGGGGGMSRY